ncbi:MAG: tRNA-dihydrouridine synthase family protein [Desulfovibrionaceae bacterium]|nr:tRNA-dihydrouridine synthase family protein [Desulfovibrionaceae bacterium]
MCALISKINHSTTYLPFGADAPWLAPLAGYSDLAFRIFCRRLGAACCTTEMISAKGLIYQSKGTFPLLKTTPEDSPLIVQLFGADPEFLAQSVRLLVQAGYEWFDLNLGCSVPKVIRQNAGAGLLKDPQTLLTCAKAMINEAAQGHVGFKLRLGFDAEHELPDLPLELEDLGAGWITLHPRYAKQYFKGSADHSKLAALAKRLQIPLVGSGDLLTAQNGLDCLKSSNVSTVMYARGALRNPLIFWEHRNLLQGLPIDANKPSLKELMMGYLDLVNEIYTERDQTKRMRGILAAFVHGEHNAKEIRIMLASAQNMPELYDIINNYVS